MKIAETYSTYAAKAHFSEIIRLVRKNRRVIVTHRGKAVAQITPIDTPVNSAENALKDGIEIGLVTAATKPVTVLKKVADRPGAVKRFLADRD